MSKVLKSLYPKGVIRFGKKLLTPTLRKKWKKNPVVADWVQKGWIKDDEIDALVSQVILKLEAHGAADMGRVMKAVTPLTAGKADGKSVNAAVRRLLV